MEMHTFHAQVRRVEVWANLVGYDGLAIGGFAARNRANKCNTGLKLPWTWEPHNKAVAEMVNTAYILNKVEVHGQLPSPIASVPLTPVPWSQAGY
jgi:hypothetical protein